MKDADDAFVIADFPQLRLVAWNRNPQDAITGEEALDLYERNWRFIDENAMEPHERTLLDRLTRQYGNGILLFDRPHHQRIARFLASINADFLAQSGCYFGGGTAIVLLLGEYRESVDVAFLCSSIDGYRALRTTITNTSLGNILSRPVELAREVRADRYGIRTFVCVDGIPIKFEIVCEGRFDVSGSTDVALGVPTLSRVDMYAEKLLANADRCTDRSVASRDAIDLAMLIDHWGGNSRRGLGQDSQGIRSINRHGLQQGN
ncbi:nucleotidyl transferase AbiEii/AbiGii toxin family protein [Noviherbaspirillum denitrificans]|uniref:nucleotidyl transferase AbiEii/AbiGii toxin family protein n=1 Tax=Noviherbaspirillum denitrificans TaxID=1968433 RepID=UPI00197DC972|nr:nucleotidyl transferase AbiEii/AbiGii toxin family protein [Noviherbaspirillum denitrificans]